MNETAQEDIVAFLMQPATYGLDENIVTHRTHISAVFLAGERAYKLKRAVQLPYVDFSTARERLGACDKEVALNRRRRRAFISRVPCHPPGRRLSPSTERRDGRRRRRDAALRPGEPARRHGGTAAT